ncbi:GlxA family transcriptional regulator [Mitsuaria sp. GD03876]|uniref:GlxA family transcriptional regulator n=1 Tax=Mitsuaria sp. GD03876 TaxID=2975399 RepID=UPI00244C40F1|nr:GlxA family transcriptional regulator [Mitsuaria sp. GD03876]MDH0864447.1 GlxA family transcriptional regulator [Mitsuaria sp. GD03876]
MHRIGYVLNEGFQLLALGTQAAFEYANFVTGQPFYEIACYTPGGGEVRSSMGVSVSARPLTAATRADTWIVAGVSEPVEMPAPEEVLQFLRRADRHARRIAGICTGGFVLADAGLLDGRRATTHWHFARAMKERHPSIDVDSDRIFIVDGPVWTSAGMTAGLDLALAMVEKDLGEEIARSVAHKLVMQQRRSGGQSQHSEMLDLAPRSDRIQQALAYARANLARPLSVEELAEVAALSPRQFSRVFSAETGVPPAKAVEGLRLEAARLMIEQSRHSLEVVAREVGFRDRRHLREVYVKHFGVAPQAARRGARAAQ